MMFVMSVPEQYEAVADAFQLATLPSYQATIDEAVLILTLREAIRLERVGSHIVRLAAALLPRPEPEPMQSVSSCNRSWKQPAQSRETSGLVRGAETMIAGGITLSYQSEGIAIALNMLAPREDGEDWYSYIRSHRDDVAIT